MGGAMKKLKVLLTTACFSFLFSMEAFANWVQVDSGQWKYDLFGTYISNQWVEDEGNWYYLDDNGIMLANITQEINSASYTFDTSGKCMNPGTIDYKNTKAFIREDIGFSVDIPTKVTTDAFNTTDENFSIESEDFYINLGFANIESDLNPWGYGLQAETQFCKDYQNDAVQVSTSYKKLGDFYMYYREYLLYNSAYIDFYSYVEDHKVISIVQVSYSKSSRERSTDILNTLKKIS